MELIIACIVCLVIGVVIASVWIKSRGAKPKSEPVAQQPGISTPAPKGPGTVEPVVAIPSTPEPVPEPKPVMPDRIVVTSGHQEVMSMSVLHDQATALQKIRNTPRLAQNGLTNALRSVIEPLAKMAPAAATAAQANNSQLMEVVINGNMLAAADGDGLRAIALAPKGFEHARLYQPENLQKVANMAAAWQIASVIVVQKHLADISATLKRVESKVDGVQDFLEKERWAVVVSARNYLEVAKQGIDNGEFLERTRDKLEHLDIELDRAGLSYLAQLERENSLALETDTMGCEGEFESAKRKQAVIGRLIEELTACNEVRLANWYLCSLYPDNSKMLHARLEQINKRIDEVRVIQDVLKKTLVDDLLAINASFTTDSTIKERRDKVKEIAFAGHEVLKLGVKQCEMIIQKIDSVRSDRLSSNRILVETHDGAPTAVYLCQ